MEILIDGVIYQELSYGGILRVFDNVIPILCELDDQIRVRLILTKDLLKPIPRHNQISVINLRKWDRFIRPYRVWHKKYPAINNFLLKAMLGDTQGMVWFSTYYSTPGIEWKGYQVVLAHDFIYERYPSLIPNGDRIIKLKKESLLHADAVICVSHTTARDLVKYYPVPESKIFVVENGYDQSFTKRPIEKISYRLDFPFILFVGNRKYYKGFDTVLAGYCQWVRNQEIKLVVVGEAWSGEEETYIQKNGLQEKVVLLKNIQDDQLCDLYNQSKAFVYPSLFEGFGIPLLEAMACGCPIVASRIPSTEEVAKDIPFYFEAGDAGGFANALSQAMDEKVSEKRVDNGLSHSQQYSWARSAQGYLNVIKEVSNTHPGESGLERGP